MNLDYIHNKEESYIGIATYDHKSVHFYAAENDVKIFLMPDINNPFCPLPREKLFLKAVEQRSEIDKVIEKVNSYILEKNNEYVNNKKSIIPGSVSGSAVAAGIDSLMENGGRVMLFTCNTCVNGFGACKPREESKLFNTPNEKTLYVPQHTSFNNLVETCIKARIVIDQFIFGNNQFDLATFSVLSNMTGGAVNFYQSTNNPLDIKTKLEKLHYDLSRILTRPNYYDVKFMLRYTLGMDAYEILGPFNKKLGEGFSLAGCDPDYGFAFNLRLSESLKTGQRMHFQLVCLYIDNYNQRYLRIMNYTVGVTNEVSKIYSSVDVDALVKVSVMKEVSLCYGSDTNTARDNLYNRIINSFYYYRTQVNILFNFSVQNIHQSLN
jgi:protein transport protein SEC24